MIAEHLRVMAHNLAAAITADRVRGTKPDAHEDLVALPIHIEALAEEAQDMEARLREARYPSNVVRLRR